MTPDQIAETYEVLAPMATDYANANLERAGQAQASYGPLAQAAMGDSQTAGIGNYTYNRLVRPAVDTMRDQLIVEGYSAALNKQLSDAMNKARENYNRAARRRSNTPSTTTTPTGNNKGWDGEIETEETSQDVLYLTGSEAYNIASTYDHKLSKDELEKLSKRPMTDHNYKVYEALYEGRWGDAQALSNNNGE